MTCVMHRSKELRACGFRITPQRTAILSFLHDSPGHFSPAEIYERVRVQMPGMNEATIYRNLEFLAEKNIVLPSLTSNGHIVYEYAGHDHHHLVCRGCGKTIQVEPLQVEKLSKQLEDETGFHLAASHLTFFGFCPECSHKS
jgi:Fe2+ or Zn2+ uptake regulation protein